MTTESSVTIHPESAANAINSGLVIQSRLQGLLSLQDILEDKRTVLEDDEDNGLATPESMDELSVTWALISALDAEIERVSATVFDIMRTTITAPLPESDHIHFGVQ